MSKNTNKRVANTSLDYFKIAIILFILAFIPIAIKYVLATTTPEEMGLLASSESYVDVFSSFRSIIFIIATVLLGLSAHPAEFIKHLRKPVMLGYFTIMLVTLVIGIASCFSYSAKYPDTQNPVIYFALMVLLYTYIFIPAVLRICLNNFENKTEKILYISVMIFVMTAIFTVAISSYKYVSLQGATERLEGIFALMGYIILFLEIKNYCTESKRIFLILYGILFSAVIIGLIGCFQYMGKDFILTEFGSRLVIGSYYDQGGRLSHVFKQIYATFYNPNCTGMYTAMIAPLTLITGVFMPKKSPTKYIMLFISVLMFICLFGSNSTGGLLGICAALATGAVLICIFALKKKKSKNFFMILGLFVLASIATAVFVTPVNQKLTSMAGKFFKPSVSDYFYQDLKIDANVAEIFYIDGSLKFVFDNGEIIVKDGADNIIPPLSIERSQVNEALLRCTYEAPGIGSFHINSLQNALSFNKDDLAFYFLVDGDGNIWPMNINDQPVDINVKVPSIGFSGNELFASSRGYIWSRSFPIIKNYILWGAGVDSFGLVFPQSDILGKVHSFGNPNILVDKAHNLFIQTAVNTGVLSLLAMLGIFLSYFWGSLNIINCEDTNVAGLRIGLISGITGYLVAGMATDSVIAVAPVFWAVLALGFAANRLDKI